MKTKTRQVIGILISILLFFALLEISLRLFDPLGIKAYNHDWSMLSAQYIPSRDGYRLAPGYYDMLIYNVTIGLDGLRVVPDTAYSDCVIATIGDSLTFGMGVEDNQTFTNLLAKQFPQARWVNGGLPGYSAVNVAEQRRELDADGYLWLVFDNDDTGFFRPARRDFTGGATVTTMYLERFIKQPYGAIRWELIDTAAHQIIPRADVLAFAFEGGRLSTEIANAYPQTFLISSYTEEVSPGDSHPNAQGHSDIYKQMRDAVDSFVNQIC